MTRSDEVPEFGPAIPEEKMKKGAAFRHFLLTKSRVHFFSEFISVVVTAQNW